MIGCLGKIAMGLAIAGGLTLGGCALIMGSCTVGLGGIVSNVAEHIDHIDADEVVDAFNEGVARIGSLILATPEQLDGSLTRSVDGYTGTYKEECHDTSGTCVLFGGTELEKRRISVQYSLGEGSGSVRLILQGLGSETVVARAGDSGEQEFDLEPGSNYLLLETHDYTGTINVEVVENE